MDKERNRVKLFTRIDRILGSSYDLSKVIRKIYLEISKVLDCSNFYIAIYDQQNKMIHFKVYTMDGRERQARPRALGKGLTEHVMKTKKPILINNNLKQYCRDIGIKPVGRDAKSWLGVPLIYKGNIEGVMTVQDYTKTDVYTNDDVYLLNRIATRAAVVIANTRLIEDEMKRAKELEAMNKIAHRLTKSLDVSDICESVTRSILQYFKNFNVAVLLVENDKIVLRKLSKGFRDDVKKGLTIDMGKGIIGTVAKTGKKLVANDVKKERLYRALSHSLTQSEIALPLKIGKRTIGVLNIECSEKNVFTNNTVRILELIADRLSVALQNARLYEEATNSAKELAVSFTIAKSLISNLELDHVLSTILKVIRDTFGYAVIAILLKDHDELYVKAAHGYAKNVIKKIRLKIGRQGICGKVAQTGKLLYAPNVTEVPYYYEGKKTIRSEAAIPLEIKGNVIGVLNIESDKPDAFTAKDLHMFSVFATQAALAIENARLYNETKELSLTDALTKIANRRHFNLVLDSEIKKAKGYSRPLSLAMIDLDDFKVFNDNFGHVTGDRLLTLIADTLKNNLRDTDFVARYGGEEFVIIFPETSQPLALKVSERLRQAVAQRPLRIKKRGKKKMTISIGIATYPNHAENKIELVNTADRALYRAKKLGKNRVESAS
jgi:diguanylate cyclase (GGDEF)-like protein